MSITLYTQQRQLSLPNHLAVFQIKNLANWKQEWAVNRYLGASTSTSLQTLNSFSEHHSHRKAQITQSWSQFKNLLWQHLDQLKFTCKCQVVIFMYFFMKLGQATAYAYNMLFKHFNQLSNRLVLRLLEFV